MRQPSTNTRSTPGRDPAEGRPDMDLPGANRPEPRLEPPPDRPEPPEPPQGPERPDAPDAERPERLGERIKHEPGSGIASGEPDLVPDVEVPEETM